MTFRGDSRSPGTITDLLKAVGRAADIPRAWRVAGDVDLLVVPGTGILESGLMTSPWGMPYWLFTVTVACRVRGRRVALLSVGAEYAEHPVTRWLNRWTVQLADYCSFRDQASRAAARASGVRGEMGPVVADLAFALPAPPSSARPGDGRTVLGVMAYDGEPEDTRPPARIRRDYLERMVDLVSRLLDEGRAVTLVVGDAHDQPVAEELEHLVWTARPRLPAEALRVSDARTLEALMCEMTDARVVVASRFHNVIAALKVGRPTISLGYAAKNAHLLAEFETGDVDQSVADIDVDRLMRQIDEVEGAHVGREARVRATLDGLERGVEEQFERILGDLDDDARPRRRARRPRSSQRAPCPTSSRKRPSMFASHASRV